MARSWIITWFHGFMHTKACKSITRQFEEYDIYSHTLSIAIPVHTVNTILTYNSHLLNLLIQFEFGLHEASRLIAILNSQLLIGAAFLVETQ